MSSINLLHIFHALIYTLFMSKNRTHSSLRYLLIFYIILIVIMVGSIFLFKGRIKENILSSHLDEHYALWKSEEEANTEKSVWTSLYSSTGTATVKRKTTKTYIGLLHGALETLLIPINEEELQSGYITSIAKGTKLLGVSEKDGYFFVSLSKEFLSSENINKALSQIKDALSIYYDVNGLTVLSGDKEFFIE